MGVLKEYKKREEEYLNRAKDLEEVTARRDAQKAKYDGLRKQRLDEFMTGFSAISAKLKEMYQVGDLPVFRFLNFMKLTITVDDYVRRKR